MTWRRGCNLLLILIVIINAAVITLPLLPTVTYQVAKASGRQQQLTQKINLPAPAKDEGNRLIIPRMMLDEPINQAANVYRALDKGVASDNQFHAPDQGGNSVLLGHRFTYQQPRGVFYQLDKLTIGDEIAVDWNGNRYHYRVRDIQVVEPDAVAVVSQSGDNRLTLYTCTPLTWPKQRLVVTAIRTT